MQWTPVDESLPTHIYTVVLWIVGGYLHCGEDYMDVGSYFADDNEWRVGSVDGDHMVKVSHWMRVPRPA